MIRYLVAICALTLSAMPAHACWKTPSEACFTEAWIDEALQYAADGNRVERLYDLINWDAVPPGKEAALTLLDDLTYDDILRFETALAEEARGDQGNTSDLDRLFPDAEENPRFDVALMLMMGYFNAPPASEGTDVDPAYVVALYNLALQTGDPALLEEWAPHLPSYLANSPELADSGNGAADPFLEGQAATIATINALRQDDLSDAIFWAESATGEPGFLAWREIARHAIEADDMDLLARANQGMQLSAETPLRPVLTEEAFEQALAEAEAEFAATGDPDAMVHVYEMFEPTTYDLRLGTRLTRALSVRYHNRQTGNRTPDRYEASLRQIETAFSTLEDEDDATILLNARTALRLGMTDEADEIISMVFRSFPGVPNVFLHDLPHEPDAWANAWIDRMTAEIEKVFAAPEQFSTREYWDLWLYQYALETSIDITESLARYGRQDEARVFAKKAEQHFIELKNRYPQAGREDLSQLFQSAVKPHLLPPDEAIRYLQSVGETPSGIAFAFARLGRYDIALGQLQQETELRNLQHWFKQVPNVPIEQREDYVSDLTALIDVEATALGEQGYPLLVQDLYHEAALFHAAQSNLQQAERYFSLITDVQGQYGLSPQARYRLMVLRGLAESMGENAPMTAYPYEDFAL